MDVKTTKTYPWVDPFSVVCALNDAPGLTLLESSPAFTGSSERSFLAACPDQIIHTSIDELDALEAGCWAGWFSYDLGRQIECVSTRATADRDIPPFALARYPAWLIFDHRQRTVTVHGDETKTQHLLQAIGSASDHTPPTRERLSLQWESVFSRERYQQAVARAIQRIYAGDLSQVNLSQRFSAQWNENVFVLYQLLRQYTPAPYMGLVRLLGVDVLSASPELFLKRSGRTIVSKPIKGTAPRKDKEAADNHSAQELLASEKNRAENTMIVDLVRNDLGRICEYGSVTVEKLCDLESHSAVHHLVSTVSGTLRADVSVREILAATFPPGSVVGAPKIQAMQLIDAIEPVRRGVYCGSLAWFEPNNNFQLSVAIRTLVATGKTIDLHTGGAVVADSQPAAEWQETLDKAQAVFTATQP